MTTEQVYIQKVHAEDVETARTSIRTACERSNAQWVPCDAIAEALLLEYLEQVGQMALEDRAIRCLENAIALLHAGKSLKRPH